MQISPQPSLSNFAQPVVAGLPVAVPNPKSSPQVSKAGGNALSGVAAFAVSAQMDELSFTQSETNLAYRKDNSLALKASSSVQYHLKSEIYRFEITLSAESLGLHTKNFANPSQPITINLQYNQSQLAVSHKITAQVVKTLRTPQEILQDLVEGLSQALRDPNNKSIIYELDEEAMASLLQSDSKTAQLFSELVMIMGAVNLMKKQNQASRDYTIHLSGKGNQYLDIQEETQAEGEERIYQFQITILPPKAEAPAPVPEEETTSAD